MPDGMTTPENYSQFKIGKPADLPGGKLEISDSVKALQNIKPDEGHELRIGNETKLQLSEEDEERRMQEQAFYAAQRDEQWGRRDRDLSRLQNAEKVADVAGVLGILKDFQDWSKQEATDQYSYRMYTKTALDGARAFGKSATQLEEEGIVESPGMGRPAIDGSGYLTEGAKVLQNGYAIRVEKQYKNLPGGKQEIKERYYFGTKSERKALAIAHEELMKNLIVTYKIHEQTGVFDMNRAALDEMVKYFYIRQVGLTNEQIKWVFKAADIKKITKENLHNEESGQRRSEAMRAFYLIGMCETKEKMEAHLNDTYNLDKFLDQPNIMQNALNLMRDLGFQDPDANGMADDIKVARFLIGKGLTYENGKWKVGWLNKDQRDPSKVGTEKEKNKRGLSAVKEEKKVRGYLTEFGNPYARGSRDTMYVLGNRIGDLVGDKDDVRIADRLFWTWGERDELGLEVFSPENIPTGEQLLETFNKLSEDYDKWRDWAEERLRYFSLPGEPIGSDLSKIFYPQFYRLKDLLNDRPTGPHLTVDKFKRFTQSLMTLARTDVWCGRYKLDDGGNVEVEMEENGRTPKLDEGGNRIPIKLMETRSIKEQFLGHKNNDSFTNEPALELGEVGWEQVTPPASMEDSQFGAELEPNQASARKISGPDAAAVGDNAMGYFWLMNFLAGNDNPDKRPWAFVNDESPDPKKLMKTIGFTGKNKFLTIVWHDAAFVFGDWRKKNKEAMLSHTSTKELIEKEADAAWKQGRKDWFAGIRSLPDYPTWGTQSVDYKNLSGGLNKGTLEKIPMVEFIERMAVRFGFLSKDEIRKLPKNRIKIL